MNRPLIVHQASNFLSRLYTTGFHTTPLEDEVPTLFVYPTDSIFYIFLSDYDEDSSADKILRPGSPGVFTVVNAADDSPIWTYIFLQSQTADSD